MFYIQLQLTRTSVAHDPSTVTQGTTNQYNVICGVSDYTLVADLSSDS